MSAGCASSSIACGWTPASAPRAWSSLSSSWGSCTRAALQPGEDEDARRHRARCLRSADTIQRLCAEGYRDLYEADQSVLASLGGVWKRVSELAAIEPRFAPYPATARGIKAQLEDLATTLRDLRRRHRRLARTARRESRTVSRFSSG